MKRTPSKYTVQTKVLISGRRNEPTWQSSLLWETYKNALQKHAHITCRALPLLWILYSSRDAHFLLSSILSLMMNHGESHHLKRKILFKVSKGVTFHISNVTPCWMTRNDFKVLWENTVVKVVIWCGISTLWSNTYFYFHSQLCTI